MLTESESCVETHAYASHVYGNTPIHFYSIISKSLPALYDVQTSEMPDIEKEVKRLFRMDNEAIDVKWEVVIEEERPAEPQYC